MANIMDVLRSTGLPCAYSHFKRKMDPPFLVYIQSGQERFKAENTRYWHNNTYQVEYYFTKKNSAAEAAIEEALLAAGLLFTRSEDIYLDDEDVFVAYYYVN